MYSLFELLTLELQNLKGNNTALQNPFTAFYIWIVLDFVSIYNYVVRKSHLLNVFWKQFSYGETQRKACDSKKEEEEEEDLRL